MGSLQYGLVYISIFHLMLTVVVTAILRSSVLYKLYTYKWVESHTASAAVDQFRRDSVLHCSVSVSTEIVTKTSGEFSFDFNSVLFVLNRSFKWAENCDMLALRFFYLGLSSVGFISYFVALKIAWQKAKFCEISGYAGEVRSVFSRNDQLPWRNGLSVSLALRPRSLRKQLQKRKE